MSKGNQPYLVRIPPEQGREMNECITRRNIYTQFEPWNTQQFILTAIREKIAHMNRSRRPRRRKAVATNVS